MERRVTLRNAFNHRAQQSVPRECDPRIWRLRCLNRASSESQRHVNRHTSRNCNSSLVFFRFDICSMQKNEAKASTCSGSIKVTRAANCSCYPLVTQVVFSQRHAQSPLFPKSCDLVRSSLVHRHWWQDIRPRASARYID